MSLQSDVGVGDRWRFDHGDKIVDRVVTRVTEYLVTSEARWVSGQPWLDGYGEIYRGTMRWVCGPTEWRKLTENAVHRVTTRTAEDDEPSYEK